MSTNAYEWARAAADQLRVASGVASYDVGVVLGSGWGEGASALGESVDVPTRRLTHFVAPAIPGHEGIISSVEVGGLKVALLKGRVHLYEGYDAGTVCHGVRTLVAAGAKTIVLTNACGGRAGRYEVGEAVVIRDHINLMGASPLEGVAPPEGYGSRFVDLGDLYDAEVRAKIGVAGLVEGVYAGFRGPHFETPAEIGMAFTMGADLVGMSTVLEAIAAKHLGAKILGLSLVTDLVYAPGETAVNVSHDAVLAAGAAASERLGKLLAMVLPLLG